MNNNTFPFLPNGTPVKSFKNDAKRLSKNSNKSLSLIQNEISQNLFNKSFNKMADEIEMCTPVVSNNKLFLPITINRKNIDDNEGTFTYFVAISNTEVALSQEIKFNFSDFIKIDWIKNIKTENLELLQNTNNVTAKKEPNGWMIRIDENHVLCIRTSDEGLVADFAYDHADEYESLESSYLFWNELASFDDLIFFNNESTDAYNAAKAFSHTHESDETSLMTVGGVDLCVYGTFTITIKEDGMNLPYKPEAAFDIAAHKGLEKEFALWLNGKHYDLFDTWKKESNVFFGFKENESGEPLGEVFDFLPKTMIERTLLIAETFLD